MINRKYYYPIAAVIIAGVFVFFYFGKDIYTYSCKFISDESERTDCYISTLRECPGGDMRYYLLSDLYLSKGDDDIALKYMNEYVKANPEDSEAHALLGFINNELDNNMEALKNINMAISQGFDHYDVYLFRGEVLLKLQKYEDAIADFTRVLESSHDNTESYIFRGDAFRALGQYQEALADYRTATKLHKEFPKYEYEYPISDGRFGPGEVNVYIKQMEILHNTNLYEAFLETYNEAVKRNPGSKRLKEEFDRLNSSFPSQ